MLACKSKDALNAAPDEKSSLAQEAKILCAEGPLGHSFVYGLGYAKTLIIGWHRA